MTETYMVLQLPLKWTAYLRDKPESGMGYHIISVELKDGRNFERIPYTAGLIDLTGLTGFWKLPFSVEDISSVVVTHDKSGPPRLTK